MGKRTDPEASRALEHLARARSALPTPTPTDPDTPSGLQVLDPPKPQERSGGHKLGVALELEQ
ncbi:hypothetical protein [Streptomyces sp. NPDC096068]|uniref:hypothetical protein n=1 Tax=Streptomyces sp. NPDC096068 TaxID=3155424 RepID=UPI0033294492